MVHLSRLLVVAGVALLAFTAYLYLSPEPGPLLEVAQTEVEITECVAGQSKDVILHLVNRSGHDIRVWGVTGC
jgi:hypothetical protein